MKLGILFLVQPTFEKYIEIDESYRKLLKISISEEKIWDILCELIEYEHNERFWEQKT